MLVNTDVIEEMQQRLLDAGYENCVITMLGSGSYKLSITGQVHVNEIKEMFEVIKWEYNNDKVLFYI